MPNSAPRREYSLPLNTRYSQICDSELAAGSGSLRFGLHPASSSAYDMSLVISESDYLTNVCFLVHFK